MNKYFDQHKFVFVLKLIFSEILEFFINQTYLYKKYLLEFYNNSNLQIFL